MNGNGARDGGEPQTVTMEDDGNTALDESGRYWLEGLAAGEMRIREETPSEFLQTFPPSGEHVVMLAPGAAVEGLDFGNEPFESGSVHGTKWDDRDGDGARDPGEPGVPGVTIYADTNANATLDPAEVRTTTMADDTQTSSDEAGVFWLDGLAPGVTVIREVPVPGAVQTFPASGFHFASVQPGGAIEGLDFGNRLPEASSGLLALAACLTLEVLRARRSGSRASPALRARSPCERGQRPERSRRE